MVKEQFKNFVDYVYDDTYSYQRSRNMRNTEDDFWEKADKEGKGYIIEEEFIKYYKGCCKNKKTLKNVWANLKKLHYRDDLKLPEEVHEDLIDEKTLARYYLITDNDKY